MDENLTLDRVGVHTLDYVFSDSWVFFFRFVCGWWLEFNLFRFRRRRIFGSLRERDQKAKKNLIFVGFRESYGERERERVKKEELIFVGFRESYGERERERVKKKEKL
jgi:hypothetical protein